MTSFIQKKNVSKMCVDIFVESVNIQENDLIIEPSAGNGSFIEPIKSISKGCIFYDILPEHEDIILAIF